MSNMSNDPELNLWTKFQNLFSLVSFCDKKKSLLKRETTKLYYFLWIVKRDQYSAPFTTL